MTKETLKKVKLPDSPGVYTFRDSRGKPLYIGKATSLKDRVKSYFSSGLPMTRGPLLAQMIEKAIAITYEETDSVLEALLLETRSIKKHLPPFNTKEKDDKSYNYIVITKEEYPRVLIVRGKNLATEYPVATLHYSIGPFPQGKTLKEGLRLIRKIFPYRDTCTPEGIKPCFNAQIGLCPDVCSGKMSAKEYQKQVKHLIDFFEGKKQKIITSLEREMFALAKKREFEKAKVVKQRLYALTHIQDISLLNREVPPPLFETSFRIESYDVAHLSGKDMVGVMVAVLDGESQKSEYRKFKIKNFTEANDPGALRELLTRRLGHAEWPLPQLIVVDGNEVQKNVAEKVLKEKGFTIDVIGVVKDERHKPRELIGKKRLIKNHGEAILLSNSEAHRFAITYHKLLRRKNFLPR